MTIEPQPPRRREDRRAHPHDDLHFSRGDALPVAMAIGVGEMAVQHGHLAESLAEPFDRLRREADFGHEHDRLTPSATTFSIAARYTSVLPLPVTP